MSGPDSTGAWRIWLHPRRTARELAELRSRECEAAEERAAQAALQAEYEERVRTLSDLMESERSEGVRREGELRNAVEEAQSQIASLERERESWAGVEAQLRDLERQIDKAVEMKKDYERRISRLQKQLRIRDTRSGSGEEVSELLEDADNNISNIGKRDSRSVQEGPYDGHIVMNDRKINRGRREEEKPRDSDWLRSLPDDI